MCASTSPDALSDCSIAADTSCGSRTGASRTHHTPSGNPGSSARATAIARRDLPAPPGPVIVTSRPPASSATTSACSRRRPTNELTGAGRLVGLSVRSDAKVSSPTWNSRTGASRSFSQCSPRSVSSTSLWASSFVRSDSSTCPPCPAAPMRAAVCTSMPTYPPSASIGSPVCTPIRTRTGPLASASCAETVALKASDARGNATNSASPWLSTSTPPCAPKTSRRTRRCSSSASTYASPSSKRRRVDPSMSVNTNVTVPLGRLGMTQRFSPISGGQNDRSPKWCRRLASDSNPEHSDEETAS